MNKIQKINLRSKVLEKSLIEKIILSKDDAIIASTLIKSDELSYFRTEFEKIVDCYKNGKGVVEEFHLSGLSSNFLTGFSPRNVEEICRDIRETSNARKIFGILEQGLSEAPETEVYGFVSDIQKKLTTGIEKTDAEKSDAQNILKEFYARQAEYKERFKNGEGIIGLSTGYENLDAVIDGLRKEHLWVIGGYTNTGKTAASLNISSNLIKQNKRVVYYSFEMGRTDILARLIGIMTEQQGTSVLKGYPHDEQKVKEATEKIVSSDFAIHSFKSELSELLFSMLEEVTRNPVDLFVIDFIQLVTIKGAKTEYETITNAILELQKAAKRLNTTIIVLSQISNDGARNADSPVMSFKGSGAIAAAADLAIEIKSGEESVEELKAKIMQGDDVRMKWDVRKNRHGRVGTMDMTFNGRTGVFSREIDL